MFSWINSSLNLNWPLIILRLFVLILVRGARDKIHFPHPTTWSSSNHEPQNVFWESGVNVPIIQSSALTSSHSTWSLHLNSTWKFGLKCFVLFQLLPIQSFALYQCIVPCYRKTRIYTPSAKCASLLHRGKACQSSCFHLRRSSSGFINHTQIYWWV